VRSATKEKGIKQNRFIMIVAGCPLPGDFGDRGDHRKDVVDRISGMMCVELSRIQREREREGGREGGRAVAARVETIRLSPFQKPRFSLLRVWVETSENDIHC
jgi:hypothetical protein